MNRQQYEQKHWAEIAQSKNYMDHIADKEVTVKKCIDAIYPAIKPVCSCNSKIISEIGCGIGRITYPLAKKMPDCDFIGLDISEGMIEKANNKHYGLDNLFFAQNDGRHLLPERFEVIDKNHAIYSMTTFQHVDAKGVECYIKECGKLLKKGGVFRFQFVEGTEKIEFSQQYSLDEMEGWLKDSGFKIKDINQGLIYDCWTWITAIKK